MRCAKSFCGTAARVEAGGFSSVQFVHFKPWRTTNEKISDVVSAFPAARGFQLCNQHLFPTVPRIIYQRWNFNERQFRLDQNSGFDLVVRGSGSVVGTAFNFSTHPPIGAVIGASTADFCYLYSSQVFGMSVSGTVVTLNFTVPPPTGTQCSFVYYLHW